MNASVAFFRGINVGGKNSLPMKELCAILTELGATKVQTIIQSGNILFDCELDTLSFKTRLFDTVDEQFGFKPDVIIFSVNEFKRIVEATPYSHSNGKLLHYFMMQENPSNPDLAMLEVIKSTTEEFRLIKNVLYLYAPNGIGRSKLVTKIEKAMGVPVTARNQNTINKIVAKLY